MDLVSNSKASSAQPTAGPPAAPLAEDKNNSLSVAHPDGKWLVDVMPGATGRQSWQRSGSQPATCSMKAGGKGGCIPPEQHSNTATVRPEAGTVRGRKKTASRIPPRLRPLRHLIQQSAGCPYSLSRCSGEELAARFRIALIGDRFRWKSAASQSCTD